MAKFAKNRNQEEPQKSPVVLIGGPLRGETHEVELTEIANGNRRTFISNRNNRTDLSPHLYLCQAMAMPGQPALWYYIYASIKPVDAIHLLVVSYQRYCATMFALGDLMKDDFEDLP